MNTAPFIKTAAAATGTVKPTTGRLLKAVRPVRTRIKQQLGALLFLLSRTGNGDAPCNNTSAAASPAHGLSSNRCNDDTSSHLSSAHEVCASPSATVASAKGSASVALSIWTQQRAVLDYCQQLLSAMLRQWKQARVAVGILATAGAFMGALPAQEASAAAAIIPVGSEFRVNTYIGNHQNFQNAPSIAMDSDGDFVVTWRVMNQNDDYYGIYAQRYNAVGKAQGSEFRVNTYTTDSQLIHSVAMDSDGDFVVTWCSYGQDGDNWGIYAQRYDASGVAQGTEFRVNTYTTSAQYSPTIAMDSDGDFVVTWQSKAQDGDGYGIYAQRYDAAGVAQGGEFRVNSTTTDRQRSPSIAMGSNGDFVVAWRSGGVDDGYFEPSGIYAQRYNASGTAQGGEFRVSSTEGHHSFPSIAMDSDGDFVVTWVSSDQGDSNDGFYARWGVYAQRYNAAGVAQGSEFRVNTYTTSDQTRPSIAMDSDGDFVVTWQSNGQDGSFEGIYAQPYNAEGMPQGTEFRVNTYTTNSQSRPRVAMANEGDFVVAWRGLQDSRYAIYAQRYAKSDHNTAQLSFNGPSLLLSQRGGKLSVLKTSLGAGDIPHTSGAATGTLLPWEILSGATGGLPKGTKLVASGDINADGNLDVVTSSKAGLTTWLLTSNSTVLSSIDFVPPQSNVVVGSGPMTDGDSMADLLLKKGAKLSIAKSTGTNFDSSLIPVSGKLSGRLVGILTNQIITAVGATIRSATLTAGTNLGAATTLGKLRAGRTVRGVLRLGTNGTPTLVTVERGLRLGVLPLSALAQPPAVTPAPTLFFTNAPGAKVVGPK